MKFSGVVVCVVFTIVVIVNGGAACPNPTYDCECTDAPVCASDGKQTLTFLNLCYLNAKNCWRKTYKRPIFYTTKYGQCDNNNGGEPCPTICPAIYQPVCAESYQGMQTFGSSCELGVANCRDRNIWRLVSEGECVA